ncbi:hypothetical protein QOT17_005267 [Balamuthia mandrillaris]
MRLTMTMIPVVAIVYLALVLPATAKLPVDECTIIKNPAALPKAGVVCANPARALIIAERYFDSYEVHTDFRGFQVYTGTYKGKKLFAANTGLGASAAAFLMEELIAHDAEVIVRLGTNDYNVTEADLNNVYVLKSVRGLWGLPRDYGLPSDLWGEAIPADTSLVSTILSVAQQFKNVTAVPSLGYSIDGFYSFFDPVQVAARPNTVKDMILDYQAEGCNCRDMESGAVLMMGKLRGIRTAAVLQAVIKSGDHHENPGTTGIPIVLQSLLKYAD